ncbi:MAG: trigger factor [Patescibacteria group bacterium]
MEYQIKKLPKSEIEITITVPDDKMPEYKKKAYTDIAKDVEIKGFRKGHVPVDMLEQHMDKDYLEAHVQEVAIQQTYAEAVVKENLQVVSRPKVKISSEIPLVYVATVAVMPEVTVKDYKSIKIKKEEAKVEDKDVEEVMKELKRYSTTFADVDRAVQKGDRVEVDFEGFDEGGAAVDHTKSTNHPVIIGENTLIPGFEDELIGLKKDEKKEFPITFPSDYHKKDFQNKKLIFKVEVKRVEEPKTPEINEEVIEKLTGKKQTLEEFKKGVTEDLKKRKEDEATQKQQNEYLEQLLAKTEVELPESLVNEEADYIVHDLADDLKEKNIEFDKFLEQTKTTHDDLVKKYRPEAEKHLKMRMALQHLLKEEGIDVTDEELQKELELMKARYDVSQHPKIDEEFSKSSMKAQMSNRIAIKKLFEKVLL